MAYSEAHEAARHLALQRWGTRGLDRAVGVVVQRSAELSPEQVAELEAAIGQETGTDAPR